MTDKTTPVHTRALGFWMCTALVVGNIIGIGVFLMLAALAPYGLNALAGWLITVLGAVFLAYVFAASPEGFRRTRGRMPTRSAPSAWGRRSS